MTRVTHCFFPPLMQALQLGQDPNSPHGFFNGQRCQMCLRSDPLHKVMERLAVPGNFFPTFNISS